MSDLINEIREKLNLESITAQCLIESGLTCIEECQDFLNPSLDKLSKIEDYEGFSQVKDRIKQAIENNETVVIYGDYDCDGICSTAMLYLYLTSKGVNTYYYIPDRRSEGYGMNEEALEEITEMYLPDLLITVDCGITSVEEVLYIQEALGFDVVVTDHHKPQDMLPNCPIFNPHLSSKGFADLCGAGVVLRLIEGLGGKEESLKYFDLAAIATIADIVPLLKDNRIIVKKGLELINTNPRPAINCLKNIIKAEKVTSTDVAFKIAPRINSVGRMDNATKLLDLFKYDEDPFVIRSLVEEVEETNIKRQNQTKAIYEMVEESLKCYNFDKYPIVVVKGDKWDEGVIGIVAAKITSEYKHPAIVFTKSEGLLKGSGRSIPQINIFDCVNSANSILDKFGGHPQACGLSIKPDEFENFKEIINKYCKENYSNDCFTTNNDKYYNFREIKNLPKLMKEMEMLQPFGEKNKKPVFHDSIKNINFKKMKPGSPHIMYKKGNFQMIGWHYSQSLDLINSDVIKDVTFTLDEVEYQNITFTQALIKEIKCKDIENGQILPYLRTMQNEDKSIFHPQKVSFEQAMEISKDSNYGTIYICYSKQTYLEAIKSNAKLNALSYKLENKSPCNTIAFSLYEKEDLSNYKNLVFLDRPLSLGYIDNLLLNKDCNVYYVDNLKAVKELKKDLLEYSKLGNVYMKICESIRKFSNFDIYSLFLDIEKTTNVNYNNFVLALHIFIDLGLIKEVDNKFTIVKGVKNPINNSKLYNLVLNEV